MLGGLTLAACAAVGVGAAMVLRGNWVVGGVATVQAAPVVVRANFVMDSIAAATPDSASLALGGDSAAAHTDSTIAGLALATAAGAVGSSPATPDTTAPAPAVPPLKAVIAEGRTDLLKGVFAVRAGDTVAVHFDTPDARTRRADKFEAIVRATLPKIYGAAADSLLSRLPTGALIAGDLVGGAMKRGIRLALADGWTLALRPETRPGRDGPLVVTYRATVAR